MINETGAYRYYGRHKIKYVNYKGYKVHHGKIIKEAGVMITGAITIFVRTVLLA